MEKKVYFQLLDNITIDQSQNLKRMLSGIVILYAINILTFKQFLLTFDIQNAYFVETPVN